MAPAPPASYTPSMPVDPADLRILTYPDPALRQKAEPINQITEPVREVARRMIELMREHEGIGLAATQVGLPWRLFVAELPPDPENPQRSVQADPPAALAEPRVYINPTLSDFAGELESYEEGCLSLPEINGEVRRPTEVTISAADLSGETFSHRAGGLLARCVQHEYDHLDGVLIIDRMTQIARMKNRTPLRQLERAADRR